MKECFGAALLCLKFREDAPISVDKFLSYLKERQDYVRVVPERNRQKLLIRIEHSAKDEELLNRIYQEVIPVSQLLEEHEEQPEGGDQGAKA